jgi:hypothetical protein
MSHGDVLLCADHVCCFCVLFDMSRCLNAAGGVTETPSVYGAIADATGCMSIETDVPAGLCTDVTGRMSSPAPVVDIFSPPIAGRTSHFRRR